MFVYKSHAISKIPRANEKTDINALSFFWRFNEAFGENMIKVRSNLSAAVNDRCSVSGKHSFLFFWLEIIWKCRLEISSNEEWTAA